MTKNKIFSYTTRLGYISYSLLVKATRNKFYSIAETISKMLFILLTLEMSSDILTTHNEINQTNKKEEANMLKQIKAILFDLDDTLIDSKTAQMNAICEYKNTNKAFFKTANKQFTKSWHDITMRLYEQYLNGEISFEKQRIMRIVNLYSTYNIEITEEKATAEFKKYLELYKKNWTLFDDTISTLETLVDKYKLSIISNGDGEQQREKIAKTGIEKYFSEIIISGEVGVSKPNKKIFEIAYNRLSINPEECLMIGDNYKTDIEGATNSGMKAIWVDRKSEKIEYQYTINELKQIQGSFIEL